MASKKDIAVMFTIMAEDYPNFKATPSKAERWHNLLEDIPSDKLLKAFNKHCMSSKWQPTIAELRELALADTCDTMTGLEAWGKVERAIRTCGRDREKEAAEQMGESVWNVARLVGWQNICNADMTIQMANRSQFIKAWVEIKHRDNEQQLLPEGYRTDAIEKLANKFRIEGK